MLRRGQGFLGNMLFTDPFINSFICHGGLFVGGRRRNNQRVVWAGGGGDNPNSEHDHFNMWGSLDAAAVAPR